MKCDTHANNAAVYTSYSVNVDNRVILMKRRDFIVLHDLASNQTKSQKRQNTKETCNDLIDNKQNRESITACVNCYRELTIYEINHGN